MVIMISQLNWLRAIKLHNWRAYADEIFEFPRYDPTRKVTLIGALNGVGKTSLIEAVTLCLCGHEGIRTLIRTESKADAKVYHQFLKKCFRRGADSDKAYVQLKFDMADGREYSVKRTWFFGKGRAYRDEEVQIFEDGVSSKIDADWDKHDSSARLDLLNTRIHDELLPSSLASYFLFDSGHVQRLARSNMVSQVKHGIESILGVPVFNNLREELHEYASKRRRDAGKFGNKDLDALEAELFKLENEIKALEASKKDVAAKIEDIEQELEDLFEEVEEHGGENVERYGVLTAQLERARQDTKAANQRLQALISANSFALTLTGRKMLAGTAHRLQREQALADWNRDKKTGGDKFDAFVAELGNAAPEFAPPCPMFRSFSFRKSCSALGRSCGIPNQRNALIPFGTVFCTSSRVSMP